MSEQAPAQLVAMLERLGLASAGQVAAMGRRVKRLARDLPRFESVWVDALLQARVLTPFQAAEINAGRGEAIRVGPYLLCERLAYPLYVSCYYARHVETHEPVLLALFDNHRDFVAAPWIDGRTAAELLIHHGRFPSQIVLEIARAMAADLLELEKTGTCHADVSLSSLLLAESGEVALVLPGLRARLRPEEGYALANLMPEAFDSLAPERVASGTPPNMPSDLYACGCVWWHLLCGRSPLPGGNSLAKLRAAQAAEIAEVRRFAMDVPTPLADAIAACLMRNPHDRPRSAAQLAAMLGPPTQNGKELLADFLARAGRPTVRWTTTVRSIRKSNRTPLWIAGSLCCLAVIVGLCWPRWREESGRGKVGSGQWARDSERKIVKIDTPATTSRDLPQRQSPSPPAPLPEGEGSSEIVPTSYQQPIQAKPEDLLLDGNKPTDATSLVFHEGQRICGVSGKRASVLVSGQGLMLDKENVCFENVDFMWRDAVENRETAPAIVNLFASQAEFHGCSFQCDTAGTKNVPAIRWVHPSHREQTAVSLPNGRIVLADCFLHHVAAGLECHTIGALAVEMKNVLHLAAGPMIRLDHCPRSDEPMSIVLAQATLRDSGPMLECLVPRPEPQPGEIMIFATACAFVPRPDEPLVRLTGVALPEGLPNALRWSGQGSLASAHAAILTWRGPDGQEQLIDEAALSIAGLVRSGVEFAGRTSIDPMSSRLVRWQAPLQSPDPPGIDPSPLPLVHQRSEIIDSRNIR